MRERFKTGDESGMPIRGQDAKIRHLLNLSMAIVEGVAVRGKKFFKLTESMLNRRKKAANILNSQLRKDGIEIFDEEAFK